MSDLKTDADINGSCASDFVGVRNAFERNFAQQSEQGAAVAVWVDGELVVNLWGGWADAAGTGLATGHADHRAVRHQGAVGHLRPPARRPR